MSFRSFAATVALFALVFGGAALAQERFSIFVASSEENIARMIKIAELRDGDVVVDLGSGDGSIVLAAARSHPGVRGWGVDIDRELVIKSNAAAKEAGLANRVKFVQQNVFDTDVKDATVIFMWLWPEMKRLLRNQILAQARPGTKVVTNTWDLGSWPPDSVDSAGSPVSLWIVPARVEGYWTWTLPVGEARATYSVVMEQRFQNVEGIVRVGNRHGVFENMRLRGDEITFTLGMTLAAGGFVRHEFVGNVVGDRIEGTVRVVTDEIKEGVLLPWRATRTSDSNFYAPVGVPQAKAAAAAPAPGMDKSR